MTTTDVANEPDYSAFDELDVFGAFDEMTGHDLDIDPYPVLAELRRRGPILPVDIHESLGVGPLFPVTAQSSGYRDMPGQTFSALSYEAVDSVLRDQVHFSQEIHRRAYEFTFGRAMNTMDEPEHRRNRNLVERAFTRRTLEDWSADVIVPLARQRAAELAAHGPVVDLVSGYAFTYPAEVITRLLGLPQGDVERFMRIAMTLGNPLDPELGRTGSKLMTQWIFDILDQRRASPPGRDVVSQLLSAEIDGEGLDGEEIASFIRLLYAAGFETTYRALSNLLVGLLTTGQWELLAADRSLLPRAIEEGLRWQPPILGHPRYAVADVEICGVTVPQGSVVHAFHASANRDETRWERADEFDLLRPPLAHSTFGYGVHLCIGKHLARAEITATLTALMDMYPDLQLAPGATADEYRIRGIFLRSPKQLPVSLGERVGSGVT